MTRLARCLLLFAIAASTPLRADPAAAVRDFLRHYAGGDFQRARDLWAAGEPAGTFAARHQRRLNARCARLVTLDLKIVSAGGDAAEVETGETYLLDSARTEESHSRFLLHRQDGHWKIVSWESAEAALADRVAAADPAERGRVLAEAPELQTETFARMLSRRAIVRINEYRRAEAGDLIDMASSIAERLGDPAALADVTGARSVAVRYQDVPDLDLSLELGLEAVSLAKASADADAIAGSLFRLARADEAVTGKLNAEPLRAVLDRADRVETAATLALVATHVGRDLNARGSVREGVRYAEMAALFAEESGDPAARISAALVLGGAHTTYGGDGELAIRHFRRAADLALNAGFPNAVSFGLLSIARVQFAMGDGDAAAQTIDEALHTISAPQGLAELLAARASMYSSNGQFAAAEREIQRALNVFPADATMRVTANLITAGIRYGQGRFEEAVALADRTDPAVQGFLSSRLTKAASLRCLGRADEALRILEDIAAREETLLTAVTDPVRLLFASGKNGYEALWLTMLVEQGRYAQALDVSERMKTSVLRTILENGGVGEHEIERPAERRAEQEMAARVATLNRALVAAADAGRAAALRAELAEARAELLDFRQRTFAGAPATRVEHAAGIALDELPPRLDDVTIASYVVTEESTTIFVVGPKERGRRTLTVRVVPISETALNRIVRQFAVLLNERNLRADAVATELYELLLRPVEREIGAARALCIVPAGDLWRVPFHALGPDRGPLVIERVPVFYAPSIAVLIAAESKRQQRHSKERPAVLAFANPLVNAETASLYRAFDRSAPLGALPDTETEVRAIAEIYGARRSSVRIGAEALEAILKREAPRYDILHVATHGLVNDNAPMFSALVLSASSEETGDDGLLEAREIARLDLSADLAVFSACDTGKLNAGVIGFSWALLAAGCPTTVVSQWNAESGSTTRLMIEFHRQLVSGAGKPEALRRAQLLVRRDTRYPHLFYWAPFVIIGAP